MISESSCVSEFIDYLLDAGYPEDKIIQNWGKYNRGLDLVVLGKDAVTPIVAFEIKRAWPTESSSANKIITVLRSKIRHYKLEIPIFLAITINGSDDFALFDLSEKMNENEDISSNATASMTNLPSYRNLLNATQSIVTNQVEVRKKRFIDGYKIVCWVVIPIVGIALTLLDRFQIMYITTERLIVWGATLLMVMLPFFSEISIKDFSLKREKKENPNV